MSTNYNEINTDKENNWTIGEIALGLKDLGWFWLACLTSCWEKQPVNSLSGVVGLSCRHFCPWFSFSDSVDLILLIVLTLRVNKKVRKQHGSLQSLRLWRSKVDQKMSHLRIYKQSVYSSLNFFREVLKSAYFSLLSIRSKSVFCAYFSDEGWSWDPKNRDG